LAARVELDKIEDASVSEGIEGVTLVRTAYVSCIDTDRPSAVLTDALRAPGLPAILSQHPSYPLARLVKRDVKPKGHDQALVLLTYELKRTDVNSGSGIIRWEDSSTILQQESSFDIDGKKMQVAYKPKGANRAKLHTAVGTLFLPVRTLRGTAFFKGRPPWAKYNGYINSSAWGDEPARTWMISDVQATTFGTGPLAIWEAHVSLTHKPIGWIQVAVIRNVDGTVPDNVDDLPNPPNGLVPGKSKGNGWAAYKAAKEIDFNSVFGGEPKF
jgi:hypothetical protein